MVYFILHLNSSGSSREFKARAQGGNLNPETQAATVEEQWHLTAFS